MINMFTKGYILNDGKSMIIETDIYHYKNEKYKFITKIGNILIFKNVSDCTYQSLNEKYVKLDGNNITYQMPYINNGLFIEYGKKYKYAKNTCVYDSADKDYIYFKYTNINGMLILPIGSFEIISIPFEERGKKDMFHSDRCYNTVKQFAYMMNSYQEACDKAGGRPMTVDQLSEMSALDLMIHLAPNNVRFVYNK